MATSAHGGEGGGENVATREIRRFKEAAANARQPRKAPFLFDDGSQVCKDAHVKAWTDAVMRNAIPNHRACAAVRLSNMTFHVSTRVARVEQLSTVAYIFTLACADPPVTGDSNVFMLTKPGGGLATQMNLPRTLAWMVKKAHERDARSTARLREVVRMRRAPSPAASAHGARALPASLVAQSMAKEDEST